MAAFKKRYLINTGLLILLFLAGYLCVHSVLNYQGNNSFNVNRIAGNNSFGGGTGRPSGMHNQIPRGGGQPDQHQGAKPGNINNWHGVDHNGAAVRGGNVRNDYSPQLMFYAVIFLILFIVAYYLFIYKKMKIDPGSEKIWIISLLCIGLFLRIAGGTLMAGHADIMLFKNWATAAAENLLTVYSQSGSIDYPPLYIYVLALIGKIGSIPAMSPYFTLLLKLPSILADLVTSLLIYKAARKYILPELSLLLSAFYIFNPAIFINSVFWGQVDSFFTLILVLAVYMLTEKKIAVSSALFAAAVLMKPQGIIFLPVLFFELLRRRSLKDWIKAAAGGLATAAVIVLPFALHQGFLWIFKLYAGTVGEYPYASVNAFNLFSLLGANYKSDASTFFLFSYHSWGFIFIILVTAFSWYIYSKGKNCLAAPAAALWQIAGVFTLATSMHERYLFPAVALAIMAFIYLRDKRWLYLIAGFSITVFLNTEAILFQGMGSNSSAPVMYITSIMNILLLVYQGKVMFDIAVRKKTIPVCS